jgi:phenylalanyl-tRNA synthetase alpha chain
MFARSGRMKERLEAIKKSALEQIEQAQKMESLNDIKVNFLGKKGELTQVLKGMKDVAKEDRPKVGQMVNETRELIEKALEEKRSHRCNTSRKIS